jgi:diacylglycerol kinase (ATP)
MKKPAAKLKLTPPPPPFQASKGNGTFLNSAIHAWNGLIYTVVHQRNMRMHMIAGLLVGLVGSGIPLGLAEKVTMIFCVLMIFFAEILNSALEQLVDLAIQQFDEKARLTKDAAAAGVLVLAIGTVVIFAAILVHNSEVVLSHGAEIQRQVLLGVPLTCCAGALMHEAKKPVWLDVALFLGSCALLAGLCVTTTSYVFSGMTFGLLVVCGAAARKRHKDRAGQ